MSCGWAQAQSDVAADDGVAPTLLPHSAQSRWQAYGQINTIYQGHAEFRSPYAGANSLRAGAGLSTRRARPL